MEKKVEIGDILSISSLNRNYFYDEIPVTFKKLTNEYNVNVYGVAFDCLGKKINLDKAISGCLIKKDGKLNFYYENDQIDTKKQRFLLASLFSSYITDEYDLKTSKDGFVQFFDENLDDKNHQLSVALARSILMPTTTFVKNYIEIYNFFEKDDNLTICYLADLYKVPVEEVSNRIRDLISTNYDKEIESRLEKLYLESTKLSKPRYKLKIKKHKNK